MTLSLVTWYRSLVQVPPGKDDLTSLAETGKQTSTLTLTFLASVIYIAITTASTTDEQLLLNAPLTLPLFNIGVPIAQFYLFAPFIVLFLHLSLLLLEYIVAFRTFRLPVSVRSDPSRADEMYVLPSITMRLAGQQLPMVTFLIKAAFFFTTIALPVSALALIQAKFLPYQNSDLTRLHAIFISADIILAWLFFWLRPRPENAGPGGNHLLRRGGVIVLGLISIAILWASWSLIALPTDCKSGWIKRSLKVRDRILALHEPPPELVAVYETPIGAALEKAWRKFSRGVSLFNRNLRCADFSGSQFINADFKGTDLYGAKFVGSNLQGANFSPLGSVTLRLPVVGDRDAPVILHVYRQAELKLTDLEGADLSGANMREVNLRFVNMRDARLEYADLRLADLSSANLDGASLIGAQLFGADLKSASLRGAVFQGAQLQGANLRRAQAEFSSFVGAVLDGVDFSGMSAEGADFRSASLQRSLGLMLRGVDLSQANVAHTSFCTGRPEFTSLREMREEPSKNDIEVLIRELSAGLSEDPGKAIRSRMDHKEPVCLDRLNRNVDSFYDEEEFLEGRAAFLVRVACERGKPVQDVLVRTIRERLLVDSSDPGTHVLIQELARELREGTCPDAFALDSKLSEWVLQQDLSLQ